MANRKNTFLIKRSNVAGKVPAAGDLLLGELAINTADGILYASGTTANSILPIGWDRVARTGDTMTGSLYAPSISATTISATTYLNLPSMTGSYLPLSGGTVFGPTIYTGGLTANTLNVTGLTQTSGITSTGGITFKQVTINSSYTATTSDYMIDVSGGTFSVTLPSAVGIQGRLLVVKNNGGGAVTVQPILGQNIDDKPFVILGETNSLQLASNGTNWVALGYNISTVNSSTGVFEFSGLSKVTSTTFRVAEVKGWIVDDTTNPLSPQLFYVYFSGGTFTDNYVTTANETYIYLTSGGTISQQSTPLTPTQRRLNIFLGKLGHPDKTTINLVFSQPDFVLSPLAQLRDMFTPINLINGGVYPSANTGLTFNTSAGYLYGLGINFASDTLNPNTLYNSGTNPCTFQYRTQTGGTITNVTNIDPLNYDVNGTITPISGTKATNQRIYLLQNGTFRVQYGQHTYSNFVDAVSAIQTETFTPFPNFVNNAVLIGILTVLSSASDLTDTSKAQFFFASKFGETIGAAGGISTTTLQQAYNNSTNPEIITNSTLGGVTVRGGTGIDTNANIVIENNAGNVTGQWLANGTLSATTISATTYYNLPNTTLQQAYTASTSPQFTINSTQLGVQFRNDTGNDSNPMIVIQNNAGVDKGEWRADGSLYATDVYSTGVYTPIISAVTYQNLPTDVRVTGGTYNAGTATFTNNTGGTFTVTGFNTGGSTGLTATDYVVQGYLAANQTISANTDTIIQFTDDYDPQNWWNASTYRFTPTIAGYYQINLQVLINAGTVTNNQYNTQIRKNGNTQEAIWQNQITTTIGVTQGNTKTLYLNGTTDYIDFTVYQANPGNVDIFGSAQKSQTFFHAHLLTGLNSSSFTASNLGAGTGIFAQKSGVDFQFKSLTSTGGTVTISNTSDTVNIEVVPASNFTGGTVTGATRFTNGLSANTISATTYFNLPTDIRVTGGTYNAGTATFTNNTGGTFSVTGFGTSTTDVYVTGGTYSNGSLSFTNNTGGTFNINTSTNYAAGVISGATYSSTGTGQVNLPAIKVALYNNANNIEPIIVYDVASGATGSGGIPSLVDQDTNYIVVEYNGGSPRYYVYDNDGPVNDSSTVLFMIVYRAGNFVHTLEFGNQGAGLANKLNDRFIMTDRFGYESGLALSLSADTGIVMCSAGVAWNGPNRQSLTAVNSSGDTFFKNYHSGGTWTYSTTGKTVNNTYYDNGTDIVAATAGKYLTNWYFRGQETNGHIYEVYSPNQYDSVALAQLSTEPALPELITSHAILIGRIIIQVAATTGLTESAFNTVFQSTQVTAHNDLSGLQGGTAGQYYHLTSNQYNNLALTNVNNNFTTGQTITGNLTVSGGTQSLFSGNSSSDLVRIIQTGSGNAFVVEDSANDTSKFIIDSSGNVGIGISPNSGYKTYIYTNASAQTVSLYVQNQSSNAFNVGTAIYGYGLSVGVFGYANGNSDPIGLYGYAEDGNTVIGIVGAAGISEFGSADTTIGGKFDASQAGYGPGLNPYSVQLIDGTEGVGKVLVSKTADGKANWSSSLTGLTTVEATTVSATTLIGDGSQITNISTSVPYGIISAIASGNYLI